MFTALEENQVEHVLRVINSKEEGEKLQDFRNILHSELAQLYQAVCIRLHVLIQRMCVWRGLGINNGPPMTTYGSMDPINKKF
jgi:hypothetical protein